MKKDVVDGDAWSKTDLDPYAALYYKIIVVNDQQLPGGTDVRQIQPLLVHKSHQGTIMLMTTSLVEF